MNEQFLLANNDFIDTEVAQLSLTNVREH